MGSAVLTTTTGDLSQVKRRTRPARDSSTEILSSPSLTWIGPPCLKWCQDSRDSTPVAAVAGLRPLWTTPSRLWRISLESIDQDNSVLCKPVVFTLDILPVSLHYQYIIQTSG